MSDNFREIENDGTYKSRHTSQAGRTAGGSDSQSRSRAGSKSAQAARPAGGQSRKATSESPQRSAHSSAVGKYTGGSGQSDASPSDNRSEGFRVSISEDDYFDAETARKEMSAARRAAVQPQRSKVGAPANRRRKPAESRNPATAKRVVTGSMGDTYQIEDDSVMAPKQIRSKQKSIRKRNRGCMIALVYSAAVLSISILLSYYLIVGVNDMFALVKDETDIVVDVPKDADLNEVTRILDDNDVVEYPFFFKTYARFSKKATGFKAGTFTINSKSDYNQILQKLRRPAGADKSTITVTIPEGLTVQQIAVLMEENSVCDAENFLKSAQEVEFTQKFMSNVNTKNKKRTYKVEGFLFPDTYNFYLNEGSVNAINRLLNEYEKHWTADYDAQAKKIGMSMDEVITLASIVEREASKSDQRMIIASVFYNRLHNSHGTGGKLQSDATRWYPYATKKELLASDKLTQEEKDDWISNNKGVCDTYRLKGLPPSPICNPSIDSIEAVLYHDKTNYYYFCSDAEGNFYAAATLAEHNRNLRKAGLA